jgi:hypothetical protein
MKLISKLFLGLIIFGTTALTSCKKEGCTDPESVTFSADADSDDGTCKYESNALFWYNQATANGFVSDGATSLTYYVDGQIVGSTSTSVYWTSSPDCGANGSITITKDLGTNKTKVASYSVVDQTGAEYASGTLNFDANTCLKTEISY